MSALRAWLRSLDRDDRVAIVTAAGALGAVNVLVVGLSVFAGKEPLIAIGVIDAMVIIVAALAIGAEKMVKK